MRLRPVPFSLPVAVLWLLTAPPATAKPPASSVRRAAVLIIPMDQGAENVSLKAEAFATAALGHYESLDVRSGDDLFGVPPDEAAEAGLRQANAAFAEGASAFESKYWSDAETKLRAAIRMYDKAAPAMKSCARLCDATAMYAAVMQARGDAEEAKLAVLEYLALKPQSPLDPKRYPPEFQKLVGQVEASQRAQVRNSLVVSSSPPGARVYLNGESKGYAPLTIPGVPIGKVLVHLERPGFMRSGRIVSMALRDEEVAETLRATEDYRSYDGLMDRLATEALKNRPGSAMTSVGKMLGLDRAVIGILRTRDASSLELSLVYADLRKPARLSALRSVIQGDEYGQLDGVIGRLLTQTVNTAEAGARGPKKGNDPLEGVSGTEDWGAEDRGGTSTQKDRKRSGKPGDPLERVSGTEGW